MEQKKDKTYWEHKHPEALQLYNGRPLPNGKNYLIDVRHFIWQDDIQLIEFIAKHNLISLDADICAHNAQKAVVKNFRYVSDKHLGRSEYWLFPAETLAMRTGDCEDGAILMASLILNMLAPKDHWRVRVCAGWVQSDLRAPQGGHAYVTYCRKTDNEWVVLDWCYHQDSRKKVADKPLHKHNRPYKDIWWSFNHLKAWNHKHFETITGRVNAIGKTNI